MNEARTLRCDALAADEAAPLLGVERLVHRVPVSAGMVGGFLGYEPGEVGGVSWRQDRARGRDAVDCRDVAALVPHRVNWVRAAANSGALESLPRGGRRHLFLEEHVADWIGRGAPKFPGTLRER